MKTMACVSHAVLLVIKGERVLRCCACGGKVQKTRNGRTLAKESVVAHTHTHNEPRSPSAATLGSEFQPPHPSSTSSGEGVGGPQQLHQTRSAGPLQDHYGPAPASPYWPEPQHPHSGVGGGGYAHHPHGGERPLEKPASFPTVPPGYHSGGGYQSMPPAQAANSPYGYYGSQQAPNVPQVRSQPVVPTSPMMINNGQEGVCWQSCDVVAWCAALGAHVAHV